MGWCGYGGRVASRGAGERGDKPTLLASGAGYDAGNPNTATADLTTLGTSDWIQWGGNGDITPVRKVGGGNQISGATRSGSGGDNITFSASRDGAPTLSWSDGDTVAASAGNRGSVSTLQTFGFGQGLQFSAACTGAAQTLTVFGGTYNADYSLSAQLFDGATPSGAAVVSSLTGQGYRDAFAQVRYDFSGTSTQNLRITLTTTSKPGDFSGTEAIFYGASLANAVAVPEPSALLLGIIGIMTVAGTRRRRWRHLP